MLTHRKLMNMFPWVILESIASSHSGMGGSNEMTESDKKETARVTITTSTAHNASPRGE